KRFIIPITYLYHIYNSTTVFSSLSLHAALPISAGRRCLAHEDRPSASRREPDAGDARCGCRPARRTLGRCGSGQPPVDGAGNDRERKSTRLNSSHVKISYAVLCVKIKMEDERGK